MTFQNLFRYSNRCVLRGLCNSRNSALACTKSVFCHFILPRCQLLTITFWGIFEFPPLTLFACLQLLPVPSSKIVGRCKRKRHAKSWWGREKEKNVSSHFIFVFALSQFSRPDHLGAWNRLLQLSLFVSQLLPTEPWENPWGRQSFYP